MSLCKLELVCVLLQGCLVGMSAPVPAYAPWEPLRRRQSLLSMRRDANRLTCFCGANEVQGRINGAWIALPGQLAARLRSHGCRNAACMIPEQL